MSSKDDRDNRSNQMNPNNPAYSSSRGYQNGNDDDDGPAATSDCAQSGWALDYTRRLREAQRRAIERGERPPTSVDIYE